MQNTYFTSYYDIPKATGHVKLCDFDPSIIRLPYLPAFKIINYNYFIKHIRFTIASAFSNYAREWYTDGFKFAAFCAYIAEQEMKNKDLSKIWNACLIKASTILQIDKEIEQFGIAVLYEHWVYGDILKEYHGFK